MTLDEYREWAAPRCKEVPHLADDLPCLLWQGATINKGRDPRAVMRRGGAPVQVRREVWHIAFPTQPLGRDAARPACDCQLCVEPTHLRRVAPSEFRAVPKSLIGRKNMRAAARALRSHVQAPEIVVPLVQADPRPAWQVAQELGLGKDVIRAMRAGQWDDAAFGPSPFAGLGART